MEDKKRKKDEKRKREASQKVIEQKIKVPDLTKPTSVQSPATQSSSASLSPGPTPSASPSPGTSGSGSAAPSQGGNNAKRLLVANGQPTSISSSSSTTGGPSATGNGTSSSGGGAQTPQQQPRYMPREVPPRFRCQQDHKVLLKRGQPPLSSMLLGGGGGDSPNANLAVSESGAAASTLALTSSSVAASTTSNYANSMWGVSSGSQASSQGREKVIVDGNDLEEWPSIAGSEGGGGGGSGGSNNNGMSVNSTSASGNQPSPTSSLSLPNECMQSPSGVAWGTAASQGHLGGGSAVAMSGPSSLSKASTVPGSHDASGPMEGNSGIPGANLNPNANPSAWPALVQQDGSAASGEGGPSSFQHQGPGGPLSANNSSLGLGMLGGQSPLSVNQSSAHQHQLHQMQSREGKWDSESVGPNTAGGEGPGGVMDRSGIGGDHSLVSSWRGQPSFPASNSKTGASRTDGWDTGGGTGVFTAAEGDNGTSGWGYPGSTSGVNAWGNVGGNTSQTSGVSQGGWGSDRGAPSSDWGGGGGEVKGEAASSNSGVGATGIPPTSASSSLSTTMSRAWDNQKGEGESGEWVGGQGAQGGSSSSGGNSRAGSGPNSGNSRSRRQPPNADAALQNLLNRSDLDPRVLSNTGWGQTQIRQNTTWDVENPGQNKLGSKPTSSGGGSSQFPGPRSNISESMVSSAGSTGEGWESSSNSSSSGASISGRGPPTSSPNIRNVNMPQSGPVSSTGPVTGSGVMSGPTQQGTATGWGRTGTGESQEAKGWGNEEWRDARPGNGGGWGNLGQQGEPLGGGWGEGQEEKGTGGWKELGGDSRGSGWGSGQKVRTGRDWGEQERKSNGGGWEDERKNGPGNSGGDSGGGGWGSWDENGPRRTWGAGGTGGGGSAGGGMGVIGSKSHQGWSGGNKMHQMPNSQSGPVTGPQAQLQQQQSQPRNQHPQQALDQGVMQGAMGRKPMPPAQNQSSGWTSGPIPSASAGSGPEPSGWEEPSPQSISRKSDFDDGTSAWGDPTNYNDKPVNLWDKNNPPNGSQSQSQGQTPHQPQGPTGQPPPNRQPPALGGNFSTAHGPGKAPALGPSGWGGTSPTSPSVDKGTAAWGKPTDAPTGWGDPEDVGGKSTGWGSSSPNPMKSGSKSMQDGWGDKEGSVAASRHSSWEEEEEGGGMWNSAGSQGSGSSWGQGSNGGWGQSHSGKKPNNKGPLKSGDSWMGPLNRQFSNMGLLNDDPGGSSMDLATNSLQDKKMDAEKRGMGMNDYNGDMRKAGRGGVGMGYRSSGAKDAPGDAGSFYDKTLPLTNQDGFLGDEGSLNTSPIFYKPHSLFNHTLPLRQGSHGIFGNVGGMPQSRHQPSVPPMNQSPGIRAQVPHQFLSPQVPGSVLKQMPPPSGSVGGVGAVGGVAGVGGGVFPPQLSPQHIAMLGSIYPPHIQFQLACQLLLQQPQQQQQQQQQQQLLQNQRKFTPNVRQQTDPQQLARIMAVLQQQRQQQQVGGLGGSSKLSPSHLNAGGVGHKIPMADPLSHSGLPGSVADLQQKTQGPYSGFGSGMNLSGLDLGSSVIGGPGPMKDFGAQQSRFKWMMEGQSSPDSSHAENAFHKNGPVTPMKMPVGSPYSPYDMMIGDGLGDNWHRTPGNKMGAKSTTAPSWPPEFQPGVPWKGIDRVDPDTDPYITPAMMGNAVSPGLNDNEHQLLDNTDSTPPLNTLLPSPGAWPFSASDSPLSNAHNSAKYTDFKTSWPPEPIGPKSWKANRGASQSQLSRPPPGLASQKQPSPTPWSGGAPRLAGRGWSSGSGTSGTTWSDGSPRESCWLVLSNLTPQIDGSTLRTICMQHGPLLTFHLGLTQGTALIRYSSRQEAAKAQSALHMCVLGNTTILAEFVSEEDVARYIAHSQAGGAGSGGTQPGSAGSGPAAAPALGANGSVGDRGTGGSAGAVGVEAASTAGTGPNSSGWDGSLDSTGSSSDQTATHGPGLGIFAHWSSNGATSGAGGVEAGRQALWGGMGGMSGAGYHSNSLWGSPALEDRHQMGSPASLLPGDLLGGGTDSN